MWDAYESLKKMDLTSVGANGSTGMDEALEAKIKQLLEELPVFMSDDFSTAKVLANIFELVPIINSIKDGITPKGAVSVATLQQLAASLQLWLEEILGLRSVTEADNSKLQQVMELLIDIRKEAKGKKDFATSDKIRDRLAAVGILLKDEKGGGMSWTLE